LTDLAAVVPGDLTTAVTTTQTVLVAALVDLGKAQAARNLYTSELAARTDAVDFDAGAAVRIAFAALRGDA
jgi:hypothetical protein